MTPSGSYIDYQGDIRKLQGYLKEKERIIEELRRALLATQEHHCEKGSFVVINVTKLKQAIKNSKPKALSIDEKEEK